MNLYTVFRDKFSEEYTTQEIIVAANSKLEAMLVGMNHFNLSEKELGVYNLTEEAKKLKKAEVICNYIW